MPKIDDFDHDPFDDFMFPIAVAVQAGELTQAFRETAAAFTQWFYRDGVIELARAGDRFAMRAVLQEFVSASQAGRTIHPNVQRFVAGRIGDVLAGNPADVLFAQRPGKTRRGRPDKQPTDVFNDFWLACWVRTLRLSGEVPTLDAAINVVAEAFHRSESAIKSAYLGYFSTN